MGNLLRGSTYTILNALLILIVLCQVIEKGMNIDWYFSKVFLNVRNIIETKHKRSSKTDSNERFSMTEQYSDCDRIASGTSQITMLIVRNATVTWSGGSPTCDKCSTGILAESFACSSPSWEWKTGMNLLRIHPYLDSP